MSEQQHADFEIDMDLTETDAWGGEQRPLVPAGDYKLTITAFQHKTSGKGTSMIEVTFEVADEGEQKGAKVWNNYPLTDNAKGRMKALMVAAGTRLDKIVASDFLGATILGTVVHTEGAAQVDANGVTKPARTFANVINERPLEAAAPAATASKPPVTKGAPVPQNAKPANSAPRRA